MQWMPETTTLRENVTVRMRKLVQYCIGTRDAAELDRVIFSLFRGLHTPASPHDSRTTWCLSETRDPHIHRRTQPHVRPCSSGDAASGGVRGHSGNPHIYSPFSVPTTNAPPFPRTSSGANIQRRTDDARTDQDRPLAGQ
ncbi:hypothetical protein OF83DRAFT_864601 [Amylostereum chailletii]|nr:hypothetical protein OF83DRAFT_864601 [Amylostereum chailletii]